MDGNKGNKSQRTIIILLYLTTCPCAPSFSLVDKFVSLLEAGPLNHDLSKVREGWYYYCAIQISGLEGIGEGTWLRHFKTENVCDVQGFPRKSNPGAQLSCGFKFHPFL